MKKELSLILVFFFSLVFLAAVECPLGIENDVYPGDCGKYTDVNQNSICDLSEDLKSSNSEISNLNNSNNSIQNKPLYNFPLIVILSTFFYLASYLLVKFNKITIVTHKKFWNSLLLLSFLFTAFSSIVWILKADYGIASGFFREVGFWHIEIGLVMIMISIFHALWHWNYFKSYLKLKK